MDFSHALIDALSADDVLAVEFRTPLAPDATLFLVKTDIDADRLERQDVERGRIWTLQELELADARPLAMLVTTKLLVNGVIEGCEVVPRTQRRIAAEPVDDDLPARVDRTPMGGRILECPCPIELATGLKLHSLFCRESPDYVAAEERDAKRPTSARARGGDERPGDARSVGSGAGDAINPPPDRPRAPAPAAAPVAAGHVGAGLELDW